MSSRRSNEARKQTTDEPANGDHQWRLTVEELKRSNEHLEKLMESTAIGTLFLDADARVRRFTPSILKVFDLTQDDEDRPFAQISHRLLYTGLQDDIASVSATREAVEREATTEANEHYNIRIHAFINSEGRLDGTVLTFYDITAQKGIELAERRARDEAIEASRAKGVLLTTLSHEFRTPLNGILGYTDLLLLDNDVTTPQADKLHRIKAVVWHLSEMIDEILSLARLDVGQERASAVTVDMRDVARDAALAVEPFIVAKNIELVLAFPDEPVTVVTDHVKARQILINMLGNAAKYTNTGEIIVSVESDVREVRVSIADTGIGIAEEHFENIFQRFWQVSGGDTRLAGGTGLGLAAAREFSHLLGGNVTVNSKLGTGSVFTLTLPLTPPRV